jgi:hypothetical protein
VHSGDQTSLTEMMNLKYVPKLLTSTAFFLLFACSVVLFFGRTRPFFKINALTEIFPDFYQNISNFSISYLLFSGIGFMWLMLDVKFEYVIALGAAILIVNFAYELWIPVLNTPDIVDAYYGLAGTLLAFVFLLFTTKYGLEPNEKYQPKS